MNARDCIQGKTHRFDPTSGYCIHGCGNRDDGHVTTRKGDVVFDGPMYTPEELAGFRRQIDPRGDD